MTAPKVYGPDEMMEKIVKLAKMTTDNGASENEAASAASKMQDLLQRYNLSMADVDAATLAKENPFEVRRIVTLNRYGQPTGRSFPWLRTLAYRIARAMFCECFTSPTQTTFIGRKHDLDVAEYAYNFLRDELERGARSATATYTDAKVEELQVEHKGFLEGENHPNVYRNSWLDGAVSTVTKQLEKQAETFSAQSKKSALVVVSAKEQAHQFATEQFPDVYKTATGKERKGGFRGSNGQINLSAYTEGAVAGAKIKVLKGVKSGAEPKQIA